MNLSYLITPFLTWLIAGCLKFLINSIQAKKLAFGLIGYGGIPSNHSAIVTSMVTLIGLNEGIGHPAFGVATTLAFIVMLDANSLRQEIGKHAIYINMLSQEKPPLRERIGHTRIQIIAGAIVGIGIAHFVYNATKNHWFLFL